MREHSTPEIPYGYCLCGCGQKTEIAPKTQTKYGHTKGMPKPYCLQHGHRGPHGFSPPIKGLPDPRYFVPIPVLSEDETNRFWAKVRRVDSSKCWEWQSTKSEGGYGRFHLQGRQIPAHRVAYSLTSGVIPPGFLVRHECDNPGCCNPDHLRIGTPLDNMNDRGMRHRQWRKLDVNIVRDIRERKRKGETHREIAARYGLSSSTVGQIVRKEIWVHVD